MKRIIFALGLFCLLFFLLSPKKSFAWYVENGNCNWSFTDQNGKKAPPFENNPNIFINSAVNWKVGGLNNGDSYSVKADCLGFHKCPFISKNDTADTNGELIGTFTFSSFVTDADIKLSVDDPQAAVNPICSAIIESSDWTNKPTPTPEAQANCQLNIIPNVEITTAIGLTITGQVSNVKGLDTSTARVLATDPLSGLPTTPIRVQGQNLDQSYLLTNVSGLNFESKLPHMPEGKIDVKAHVYIVDKNYVPDQSYSYQGAYADCNLSFTVCALGDSSCSVVLSPTPLMTPEPAICKYCGSQIPCGADECLFCSICPEPEICKSCGPYGSGKSIPCEADQCIKCDVCAQTPTPIGPLPSLAPLCDQLPNEDDLQSQCKSCMNQKGKIWTALGCINTDFGSFIENQVFGVGMGIAGGIAFLYFIYGAFLYLTSRGNPEQVAHGKEIILSSLTGLFLIIFSIFLLRIIAVDILKLPEFQ